MKNILLIIIAISIVSCGGTQKTTNYIKSGNYIEAFKTSIAKLNKDKTKKSFQKQIPLLKEAFIKAAVEDLGIIKTLQKNKTPGNLKKIYGKYLNLDIRQDEVKALQPLYFEGNEVSFDFDDYTKKVKISKNNYSTALYKSAIDKMKGNQLDARTAYKHLENLTYIDPTYRTDLDALQKKAKNKGSNFVYVSLKNNEKAISNDSIKDFSAINSTNFNNPWVLYHNKKEKGIQYNYQVDIVLNKLTFQHEKTSQQTVPQEAKVQDGYQYKLDGNGNVMKDAKGNDIKIAKHKVVKAEVALYQQNKASKVDGVVIIKNLKNKNIVSTNPMFGEAKFQNTYGKYRGDQRAIEQKYHKALQSKAVPYPKDYEFIKYSISNIKQKIMGILSQQKF
ncbi:MAG TPA: hypothetical protein DDZ39_08155 [Flavobacteriaceae bacterium]|jgi:hypothetical protein|nr:hypothetical protein [Flavobacteriaceae bacterium]